MLLAGYLQRYLGLLLDKVHGGLGVRDIRLEGAALQLLVLLLYLLLLVLGLLLHVVDKEEILDCVAALLDLDVADLLCLKEGLQLLAGLLSEGVC